MHVARIRSRHVDKQGRRRDYESRLPAAHLPRRRQGQARDAGEPVRAAGAGGRRDRGGAEGHAAGAGRAGGDDHPLAAARARRRGARDGRQAGPARPARPGLPGAGPGAGADHLPGGGPGLQAVHPDLVGRHHPGRRPGRGRGVHRRHLRGDGLAGRPAGRDRGAAGRPAPGPGGEPVADGAVRPVQLVAGGHALPAGRPRLLPGRQEGPAADRVRAAHRPGGPPGRGPGVPRQHRRPGRVHRDRHGRAGQVRAGQDGHGRRPRHDHQRPDRGPEPAGGRARHGPDPYGWITALRAPAIKKLMAERRPAAAVACSTSRTWPRSPPRTSPASGWSPAATRCWPPTAPASARTCWPRPRSCWPPSSPASRPASSPAPGRSGSRSAR